MADTVDDEVPAPDWPTCHHGSEETGRRCTGKQADGFDYCLAHLQADELDQVLLRLHPGTDLNASGTTISAELLAQILRAVRGDDGRPTFGRVSFTQAHFTEDANFTRVMFTGDAGFSEAQFTGIAEFGSATFTGNAQFGSATFTGNASFGSATFTGDASFASATFPRDGWFGDAQFSGNTVFNRAQFTGNAWFGGAKFENATLFGPLAAGSLGLAEAVFVRPMVIEATATTISCRDATWSAGVTMRLQYAAVDLERATFSVPSFVTGADPFETSFARPLNENQVRNQVLGERGESPDLWMPVLKSLQGSDAANLSVTDVDLSQCRFAGARLLDQLRLDR